MKVCRLKKLDDHLQTGKSTNCHVTYHLYNAQTCVLLVMLIITCTDYRRDERYQLTITR